MTGLPSSNASVFVSDLHESTLDISKDKKKKKKNNRRKVVLEQGINDPANCLILTGEPITLTLQLSPRFGHYLELAQSLGLYICFLVGLSKGKWEKSNVFCIFSESTGAGSKTKTEFSVDLGRHLLCKHFYDWLPSGLVMVFVIIS